MVTAPTQRDCGALILGAYYMNPTMFVVVSVMFISIKVIKSDEFSPFGVDVEI